MKKKEKKITVLQILPSMISGGVERGVLEINKALAESGKYKSLVTSSGGKLTYSIKQAGGKHIQLPLDSKNVFTIWKNIKKLRKIIRDYKVDIVHARSRAPAWSAYFACKKERCKFVTTVHGNYSLSTGLYGKLKRKYNSVMMRGDRVIAISEYIKNYALENYSEFKKVLKKDRVDIIHRGVDVNNFDPDRISHERIIKLQNNLRLPDGKMVIMLPGRLTEWKGQSYLLDALSQVENKNYFCLIVGDDKGHKSYKKRLEEKIRQNNLIGFVQLKNHISDMSAGYMLADIVVSASVRGEAFGRVVPEAQAMKRSVIATSIGGSLETIKHNKTGWLVPHDNPKKFAAIIDKVLSMDKKKRLAIAEAGRRHIVKNFSKKKMCDKIIETYEKVLKQRKLR